MVKTVAVPVELWSSVTLALQQALADLDDASSVVDKSDDEEYAYQNTLEMLRSVTDEVSKFERTPDGGPAQGG